MTKEESNYPWDEYCESIFSSNKLSGVALLGREDGGIWGRSGELKISQEEAEEIAATFNDSQSPKNLICKEKKYIYIQDIDNIQCFKHLKTSLCVSKDKDFIILVSFQDGENNFNNALLSIEEAKKDIIKHIQDDNE